MSLQDFYKKIGQDSLHTSLYFIMLAAFFSLFLIYEGKDVTVISGIIFLSFAYYALSLYYVRKSIAVSSYVRKNEYPFKSGYFLLHRDRHGLYFFSPTGTALYKVRLKRRGNGWEVRFIEGENWKDTAIVKRGGGQLFFNNADGSISGTICRREKRGTFYWGKRQISLIKRTGGEWEAREDNKLLATVKKGWLPVMWTSLFRLNTPVISFYEGFDDEKFQETCLLVFSIVLERAKYFKIEINIRIMDILKDKAHLVD